MGVLRWLLVALALLQPATGLRVFVGSSRPSAARACAARMALPKIEDARSLSTEEIEAEIVNAKKARAPAARHLRARPLRARAHDAERPPPTAPPSQELFELRKKVKTRQQVGTAPRPAAPRSARLPRRRSAGAGTRARQVKPHLFTHTKHRIGQLQTLLSQRAA